MDLTAKIEEIVEQAVKKQLALAFNMDEAKTAQAPIVQLPATPKAKRRGRPALAVAIPEGLVPGARVTYKQGLAKVEATVVSVEGNVVTMQPDGAQNTVTRKAHKIKLAK